MKFWFDVLTPKQVNLFKPIVDELRKRKHEVLCTTRKYREVQELSKIKELDLFIVGRHGSDSYEKLKASTERIQKLIVVIEKFNPDVLVSLASPEASRIAFGLRIRHIGFNDSPHAEATCRLSVPFLNKLLCPWIIPFNKFIKYGITKHQIIHYKALDPALWIKRNKKSLYKHEDIGLDPTKKTITFRFQESKAAYLYNTKNLSNLLLKSLILNFKDTNIVVLCRYSDQLQAVKDNFNNSAIIVDKVIDGISVLRLSDVFIGSGGTMNCEASLLGIPNMSYIMHNILVNKFLFSKGLSYKCRDEGEMIKLTRKMLYDEKMVKIIKSKSNGLLSQMEDPKKKIIGLLESCK
ncbi:MAG: DUF354 domain-containing protein [Thaumarchaeota archaeon]|nr:DUF354 domain-containing protein [Nitrososphaerota archaeon]